MTNRTEICTPEEHATPVGAQAYGRWLDQNLPWWLNGLLLPVHLLVMIPLVTLYAARGDRD